MYDVFLGEMDFGGELELLAFMEKDEFVPGDLHLVGDDSSDLFVLDFFLYFYVVSSLLAVSQIDVHLVGLDKSALGSYL